MMDSTTSLRRKIGPAEDLQFVVRTMSLTALSIIETEGEDISACIPANTIPVTNGTIFKSLRIHRTKEAKDDISKNYRLRNRSCIDCSIWDCIRVFQSNVNRQDDGEN